MVITKTQPKKTKGYFSAFGVLFTQGLEGVLIPFLYITIFGFIGIEQLHIKSANVFVAAISSIKEILCLLLVVVIWGPKFFIETLKKLKTKQSWWFVLSEGLGTTVGNIFFVLGVVFAGASYGVVLTALYPIWTIILNKIFYKLKNNWKTLLGISAALISGISFILIPVFLEGSTITNNIKLGMVFGAIAGVFWALEAFILKHGMQKNPKINNKEIIVLRVFTITFFTTMIYLPLSMLIGNNVNKNSYIVFAKIFKNWKYMLILFAMAINIWVMRIFHTSAIHLIGIKMTSVIDTNNFLVPAIFSQLLQFIPGQVGIIFASQVLNPWLFFILAPLALSLMATIYYSKRQQIADINIHE